MILDDIRRAIAAARRERDGKRSLGFPEPRLVVLVGNHHAYTAARMHEVPGPIAPIADAELATFDGCDVEFGGCVGVAVEWRG